MTNNQPRTPATDCPLSGAYLIEASAGTGKTWTLTGIILRLLIEKEVSPDKIVATTFTKAAAKEIMERLHKRLTDLYEAYAWLKQTTATCNVYELCFDDRQKMFDKEGELFSFIGDPVNQHLLHLVLNAHPRELDKTTKKVSLLFGSLDKLFVGTLDSLAQKWLGEFGEQMGDGDIREMLTNDSDLKKTIVHDILRQYHARLYNEQQTLYRLLSGKSKKFLVDVDKTAKLINNAFNFYTAPIDKPCGIPKPDEIIKQADLVTQMDYSAFKRYDNQEHNKSIGFANKKEVNHLHTLSAIIEGLKGGTFFDTLDDNQLQMLDRWADGELESSKVFYKTKASQSEKSAWDDLPLQNLVALGRLYRLYKIFNQRFVEQLTYDVGVLAKDRYKQHLDEQKQTTFTLQTVRLILALQSRQGESLARNIRHLYPVALIDEAQDVSGEQAKLIELVYLSHSAKRTLFKTDKDGKKVGKGFLLLVGDPKQAIYRFRGGDVANYNYLKSLGVDTSFKLTVNRRSNEGVIDSLNHWFGGERAVLGKGITYQHISAVRQQKRLSWQNACQSPSFVTGCPIDVLRLVLDSDFDVTFATALHINTLLASGHTISDTDEMGVCFERAILPSDIAVLVGQHDTAATLKSHLDRYHIDSVHSKDGSLYATAACQAIYALFKAVLYPKEDKIAQVLTKLFRYTLDESLELIQDDIAFGQLMVYLGRFEKTWYKHGIARALTNAFLKHPLNDNTLWSEIACFNDGERWLADYWQLFEELCVEDLHPHLLTKRLALLMVQSNDEKRPALSSSLGVKLMTLHGSKGLEFPIVYILEMEKAVKTKKDILYPYSQDNQRRLSPTQGEDECFVQDNITEEIDEKRRLAYVALTRASEQVFVVLKDREKNIGKNPLVGWLTDDGKTYGSVPPDYLDGKVGYVSIDSLDLTDKPYTPKVQAPKKRTYLDWHTAYAQSVFYGISRTSFTALSYRFDPTHKLSSYAQSVDEKISFEPDDDDDIRHTFMRGKKVGVFLHKVLEQAGGANKAELADIITDTARKNAIVLDVDAGVTEQLTDWLYQVGQSCFKASGVSLAQLSDNKRTELGFTLGINTHQNFDLSALTEVFERYSDRGIRPFITSSKVVYAYLSGEIDLVYESEGKYYIVDYKSNWLGQGRADYNEQAMRATMDEHGYWLQASLYQLALHRLLKMRIKDYLGNEERYLGAVEYVFLRGVTAKQGDTGRLVWSVPTALIRALDELFG